MRQSDKEGEQSQGESGNTGEIERMFGQWIRRVEAPDRMWRGFIGKSMAKAELAMANC
jgi:hypothetical protein